MKKVAILTYIRSFNYGGDLQCFALSKIVAGLNIDSVSVLDVYRPVVKGHTKDSAFKSIYNYSNFKDLRARFNSFILKSYGLIVQYINYSKYQTKMANFDVFYDNYLPISSFSYKNFSQLYRDFDSSIFSHLIVGSDQVWNYNYPYSVEPYFLTFANSTVKKISYAASIGHDSLPIKVEQLYRKWLFDFTNISLREDVGVKIIGSLINSNSVFHALDPTMLLNKEDWSLVVGTNVFKRSNTNYVLVYLLSTSSNALQLAIKISKDLNCDIKVIMSNFVNPYKKHKSIEFIFNAGPLEFVKLFLNATYVITNSFHGTCFSVNFNIPFYIVTRTSKRVNSRFQSLLNMMGLIDRLLTDNDKELESFVYNIECDFHLANKVLEIERIKSLNFLKNALQ